ncbi:MAG: efflux RND transporter periplasmic adaptor subunit [Armatimonadetes bacterium]|nr:efflux RND transporter periplasmic adaptor subunit [Armatimonadota bacterium]
MKSKIIVLFVAIALAAAGITYKLASGHSHEHNHEHEHDHDHDHSDEAQAISIPGLKTAVAIAGEGWDTLDLAGRITVPSGNLVQVSPRIEGKVTSAHPKVGDTVRQGQSLATISSVELAEARAGYRQALARLDAARKELAQEQKAAQLGAYSVRPLEEARSENVEAQGALSDAKSELAQARSELAKCESEPAQCTARLERAKDLYADQIISRQDLESAEAEYKMDLAAVESAKSKITQSEARIAKEKSRVDLAGQYLAREEKVYKGKVVDSKALQSARSAVTAAKTDVDAAADRIRVLGANPNGSGDLIAVVSPISGRVVARQVNTGEMASPSTVMFTIANLASVWVEADVYEKDLSAVRKGQSAEIRVDAYPDRVFAAKVETIGDMLTSDSRTVKIRCVVNNSEGLLKGDMFAKVALITGKRGSIVLIPKQAVLDEAGSKIVFTPCLDCPEDQKAGYSACGSYDKLVVETGSAHGSQIEITSGLEPGTEVVTVGAYQIKTALGSGKLEAGCADH